LNQMMMLTSPAHLLVSSCQTETPHQPLVAKTGKREKKFFGWSRKFLKQEILTKIQADSPPSFREDISTTRGDKGCQPKRKAALNFEPFTMWSRF